jgi:hypothetical protein
MFDCQITRLDVPYTLHQALTCFQELQSPDGKPQWHGERPLPLISPASLCSSYGGNNTISRALPQKFHCPIWSRHGEKESRAVRCCLFQAGIRAYMYICMYDKTRLCNCRFPRFASSSYHRMELPLLVLSLSYSSYTVGRSVFRTGSRGSR